MDDLFGKPRGALSQQPLPQDVAVMPGVGIITKLPNVATFGTSLSTKTVKFAVDPLHAVVQVLLEPARFCSPGLKEVMNGLGFVHSNDQGLFVNAVDDRAHIVEKVVKWWGGPLLYTDQAPDVLVAVEQLRKVLSQEEFFRQFADELDRSGQLLKSEWHKNLDQTTALMQKWTGCDFSDSVEVRVMHPGHRSGQFSSHDRAIYWQYVGGEFQEHTPRHIEVFPNYNTVYLWHERLHAAPFDDKSDLVHAIIELLTDNALRVALNGGELSGDVGHPFLAEIRKDLFPHFEKYIAGGGGDITTFIESMGEKFTEYWVCPLR
jgi:hypothetical protein